ncbi:MAG: antitoxin Xre-like helix-turn-helix domain-containing protein [Ferruginibacter sp.]
MKKKTIIPKEPKVPFLAEEPMALYKSLRVLPSLKEFNYSEFKKISDKAPFNQSEWASLLHVSERTLQRYAKGEGSFAPINAERAMQIAQVLEAGKNTFGSTSQFYTWLKSNPQMLEGPLSIDSLTTAHGIHMVLTQLGRIQHGILA